MKLVKVMPLAAAVVLFSVDPLSAGSVNTGNFRISSDTNFESVVGSARQLMYLLNDSSVMSDTSNVSSVVETQKAGTTVNVVEMQGSMCKVITASGNIGYIALNKLTDRAEYVFTDTDEIKYASEGTVIYSLPFDSSAEVTTLEENDEIHLTGTNSFIYQRCEIDGRTCYVSTEDLMDEQIVYIVEEPEETSSYVSSAPVNYTWDGNVLNPVIGVVYGPSGKETYYNLPMQGVIAIMQNAGYNYEYWVRSDGVKMYGDYIMCAADLSIRPRGSLVETSLGTAMVCDTGSFVLNNPYQIDIAVTW